MSGTFGNPALFALVVKPLAGAPEEADASAAATWVSTAIFVRGQNLSAHTHTNEDRVDDGIHWPAIYLARWFVHHWNELFLEDRWPIPGGFNDASAVADALDEVLDNDDLDDESWQIAAAQRDRFVRSHALKAAAAGGLLPNIWMHRDAGRMVIAWHKQRPEHVFFHETTGYARIPAAAFADAVVDYVSWVGDQLTAIDSASPVVNTDTARLREWCAAQQNSETQAERWLAAYIGLSPHAMASLQRHTRTTSIREQLNLPQSWAQNGATADPSESPLACIFRCASPTLLAEDVIALHQHVTDALSVAAINDALVILSRSLDPVELRQRSWQQGYALAQSVRTRLNVGDAPLDIEHLLLNLGVRIIDVEINDTTVDGGAVWSHGGGAVVFVNQRSGRAASHHGRRMVLAHELCHLLLDRRAALPLAILSGVWAPAHLERRANAFAAELLLPLDAIRRTLGPDPTNPTDEALDELAHSYSVSKAMAIQHVLNRTGRRDW